MEKLELLEEAAAEKILHPWSQEMVEEVQQQGSRRSRGMIRLGGLYVVTRFQKKSHEIEFENGQVGELNRKFPCFWKKALVRIVYIPQGDRPIAELVCQIKDNEDNSFFTNNRNYLRNLGVYSLARQQGSLARAGGYWLGYSYKVPIRNGLPEFRPSNLNPEHIVNNIKIIVDKTQVEYKEADCVSAEISFIKKDFGMNNYKIHVNVLKKI